MDLNQNLDLNISKGSEGRELVQTRIKFLLILWWNWSGNVKWAVRALWGVQHPEPDLDLHSVPGLSHGTGWLICRDIAHLISCRKCVLSGHYEHEINSISTNLLLLCKKTLLQGLKQALLTSQFQMGREPSVSLGLSHEQQLVTHQCLDGLLVWWVLLLALWYTDRRTCNGNCF